ncbi:MAG: hypothetical protein ABSB79_16635 [Syntrophales bacterium]|jgi:hypothetical protein
MIKVGKKTKAKYWGNFTVQKVVQLDNPVKCVSSEKGEVSFNPTIVKISWEQDPSDDKHDLWFPYWIKIDGKEKYGQFAPMIGQKALLELMIKAIDEGYLGEEFLSGLKKKISDRLQSN